MVLTVIPGIILCLLICLLLPRIPFFKNSGLTTAQQYVLLSIKLAVAMGFCLVLKNYYQGGDYVFNNTHGIIAYQELLQNPAKFFSDFGQFNYQQSGSVFSSNNSFWDDLAINLLVKVLGIINLFTKGNLYLNSILFSIAGYTGSMALYRVFRILNYTVIPSLIAAFFIPSTLLYTSGVHKDVFVFLSIGLAIYYTFLLIKTQRLILHSLLLLFQLVLLFCFRNYVLLCLLPAIVTIMMGKKYGVKKSVLVVYGSMLTLGVILIFISPYNPLKILTQRRTEYQQIKPGNTSFTQPYIEPTILSVTKALPATVYNVSLRPAFGLNITTDRLPFILESIFLLLLFILGIVHFIKTKGELSLLFPLLLFCCSMLLIIGFTVNNVSAIVRYRSLVIPLLTIYPLSILFNYIKKENI